jgi:hypothetical protein
MGRLFLSSRHLFSPLRQVQNDLWNPRRRHTLMIWFYWTGFAVLVGAQLNAELAKVSSKGKLKQKHEPLTSIPIDPTA